MKKLSSRFKWVLHLPVTGRIMYFVNKPKKIKGGFIDESGNRYIGLNAWLETRKEFNDFLDEVFGLSGNSNL